MELRDYQAAAIDACYTFAREKPGENPLIVIPTGGGKSLVISQICMDAFSGGARVLILSHVKELLQQNKDHIEKIAPDLRGAIGLYSASLKSRDLHHSIIVAGIQSVYQKAAILGRFDVILIDECHMIPDEGAGRYRTFIKDAKIVNPNLAIVGFTATPYRLKTGYIFGKDPEKIFSDVCYEISVKKLIEDGYLSRLRSKVGLTQADLSDVKIQGGDYAQDELEEAMTAEGMVPAACKELVAFTADRKSVLIFATGISHGEVIKAELERLECDVKSVYGDTPSKDRAQILEDFKTQRLKYVVNIGVLTTGFDAPTIDCVAMLRPTMSPGLYYQMCGRALRECEGKEDALVLDFAQNILRHGPIDMIDVKPSKAKEKDGKKRVAPTKVCPVCQEVMHAAATRCPACSHEMPREVNHEKTASNISPISGEISCELKEVANVNFFIHRKKKKSEGDPEPPPTMRVSYSFGFGQDSLSEWICIEHHKESYAYRKAFGWWKQRSNVPMPQTVMEAIELAQNGALADTEYVTVKSISGQQYPEIIGYKLGKKPAFDAFELSELHKVNDFFQHAKQLPPLQQPQKTTSQSSLFDDSLPQKQDAYEKEVAPFKPKSSGEFVYRGVSGEIIGYDDESPF